MPVTRTAHPGARLRQEPWTFRPARARDAAALRRLAALDSQPAVSGPALIAEVGDEPWAAVELWSGRTVADPFRPSGEVAAFARAHADTLRSRPVRLRLPGPEARS